jgi:alpha-tubulin suppressor-like RCC1 family protein
LIFTVHDTIDNKTSDLFSGGLRIKTNEGWSGFLSEMNSLDNYFNYDVYGGLNVRVKKVSAGYQYSLLIGYEDEAVYAGGSNANGKTGLGGTVGNTATFSMVLAQRTADISAGYQHALAITQEGTVWAWGDGANYRTGQTTTTDFVFPVRIKNIPLATGDTIIRVEAGGENSLLLSKNGKVYAFGHNTRGVNGNGINTNTNINIPTQIASLPANVVDIALSTASAAAVTADGKVYIWGNQQYGRLGNGGNTDAVITPMLLIFPKEIKQVALGSSHGIAVSADGKTLYGWGAAQAWGGSVGTTVALATTPIDVTPFLVSGGFDITKDTIVSIAASRFTTASAASPGNNYLGASIVITNKNVYAAGHVNTDVDARMGLGYFPGTIETFYSPTVAAGRRGTIATGFYSIYDKTIYPNTFFDRASIGADHSLLKQTLVVEDDGAGGTKESGSYGYGMGNVSANQLGAVATGFNQFPIPSYIKK